MLDRGEEALAHADELVRIAPATPDAALVRVRVLENMSRTYDAADLLEEAITRCSTSRDLAICFYRLAYMEWKRGRSDLSVACYERSIALGTPLMEQAKDELADLLESDPSLKHLSEEEAIAVLKEAGIPVGDPEALRMMAARAAIAATDSNLFGVAASLTGTLIDARRDDVLVDIYHSLRVGI
jgi:tetratricopeptide (TPR) repeat protein